MKKIICVLSVLMLVLTCGCNSRNNQSISTSSISAGETSSITTSEDKSSSEASQSENSSLISTSSKEENSSKTQNNTSSKKNNTTSQPQLKPPTLQPDKESSNSRVSSEQSGTVYYEYELNGTVVDWFTKDDVIYTLLKKPNRYLAIESESGKIIKDVALAGVPAETHLFGDELWISFPDLKTIKIYDFATFNFKREIAFEHRVSAFDVYNDYIIYSEYDQHVYIYRYNIKTQEEEKCFVQSFFYADVLIDRNNKKLYIGESNGTGGEVYCYDVETLESLGVYGGYSNTQRRMFLLGDGLYWGEFKLDPNNLSRVICQYTANESWIGMLHVDENFVITNRGFYIRETCEKFLQGDFEAATITECGNIMVVEDKTLYIFTDQPA